MIPADGGKQWFHENAVGAQFARLRPSEGVTFAFYLYTAGFSFFHSLSLLQRTVSLLAPIVLFGLVLLLDRLRTPPLSRLRDWLVPAGVVAGYWQMGWFAQSRYSPWQGVWLSWDRVLLNDWGLGALLGQRVPFLSWLLELSYLSLYFIPPGCLVFLYLRRKWNRVDRYLVTFAFGTLVTYALLPLVPVQSPRLAYPGQDLPMSVSVWRSANLWILDHLDISTSVFPSGHVAVAFSSAFGLKRALPGEFRAFAVLLGLAFSIYLATIQGRYHYAVDGLASIVICLVAWGICEFYRPAY